MKRYWYIPTGNKVWFQVAVNLYEAGIAEPVLWNGDDRHFERAKNIFGDAVISRQEIVFYSERITGINYGGEYSDFFLSENYTRAKDRCMKMMDRLDMFGTFNRLDRDIIFNKLSIWILKKFKETNPEALVVSENPHTHTSYLIYEICLFFNLKVVKFNTWLPLPLIYLENVKTNEKIIRKINFSSNEEKILDGKITNFVNNISALRLTGSHVLPAIKIQKDELQFQNKVKFFFNAGLVALLKEFWFQARMHFNPHYYPINPYKLGIITRERIKVLRNRNLRRAFEKERGKVNLSSNFIYYALSFEPERTTNPDGGDFHDQAIALAKLRELAPSNVSIVVKEHPTQFYRIGRGTKGRSPIFYNFLNNIEGVTLVGDEVDSLELIRKSIFVASISGTVAFESAIMGTPTLIFGDAWYRGCPNIFTWNSKTTYDEIRDYKCLPPGSIIDFLINQKNKYAVFGCQNISAQKKFVEHLGGDFESKEMAGVTHLLEEFFYNI
ncbi:capsular biosynthesis protein [Alphaproteobacteria bacterium]|nr:capsular biosynthesis protein [Alphaproteobacteria bacterium]